MKNLKVPDPNWFLGRLYQFTILPAMCESACLTVHIRGGIAMLLINLHQFDRLNIIIYLIYCECYKQGWILNITNYILQKLWGRKNHAPPEGLEARNKGQTDVLQMRLWGQSKVSLMSLTKYFGFCPRVLVTPLLFCIFVLNSYCRKKKY